MQRGNGAQALLGFAAVTPGGQEPVFKQAAAHAGHADIQQGKQRGLLFTAQGLGEFQVAPGGLRQVDQFVVALHPHAVQVGERPALGVLGVAQQRGASGMGLGQVLRLPSGQCGGLQVGQQGAFAQSGVKLPVGPHADRKCCGCLQAAQARLESRCAARAKNDFARADAGDPLAQLIRRALGQMHFALGDAKPGQTAQVARALVHGHKQGFGFVAQQLQVGQGAGGDHTHHFALDRAFAGDFAHLLTNSDRFAQLDEAGQIGVERVKGHTRHGNRLARRLAAVR